MFISIRFNNSSKLKLKVNHYNKHLTDGESTKTSYQI